MRETTVSSTLTVYHDGRFWVGVIEHVEDGCLRVGRIVFGPEPSNEELFVELVCKGWEGLVLSDSSGKAAPPEGRRNPKRRQRETARQSRGKGPSTKAQQVLAEQREMSAEHRRARARALRSERRNADYEARRQKAKRRHRGR